MIGLIRSRNSDNKIVIGGDFNCMMEEMLHLSQTLNLPTAQDTDSNFVTHTNAANPERNNQLDFLLSNLEFE